MINKFSYYSPTKLVFGKGALQQIGEETKKYGTRALLVHGSNKSHHAELYLRVKKILEAESISVFDFDGVIPNPTTEIITYGANIAKENRVDVVIGIGGGSSIDTAKSIAVEATHAGTAFDYLFNTAGPTKSTLPIIAVGTTAGTGSQVTPCAVLTKRENKEKSAIWNENIFPKVAIVDPELTLSLPKDVTAQTGFDAFCHNFEAYISRNSNPYVELMAVEAIRIIVNSLPKVLANGNDINARTEMAWADTLGGYTNSSAGVTLPHGLGMQISGHCPQVTHGQSLAIVYPQFTRFTYETSIKKFATVSRIMNADLEKETDIEAAKQACVEIDKFLKKIGLWIGFKDVGVDKKEIQEIAKCGHVLNDYKNNPRIASLDEIQEIMDSCYERNE